MGAAGNGRHDADERPMFLAVCGQPEPNQGVRWQVNRAEFDENTANANVPDSSSDGVPPRIFNANALACRKALVRTMFHS